jgi:signal transduction histidine kinase
LCPDRDPTLLRSGDHEVARLLYDDGRPDRWILWRNGIRRSEGIRTHQDPAQGPNGPSRWHRLQHGNPTGLRFAALRIIFCASTGAETSLRAGLFDALGLDWRSNTLNPVRVDVDVLSVKSHTGVSAGAATNTQRGARWWLAVTMVLVAAFAITFVAVAVVFAEQSSANRVAENASLLHWTNAAEGSAALARSATGQAVNFGLSYELGAVGDGAVDVALDEAKKSLDGFGGWADSVPPQLLNEAPMLESQLEAFRSSGTEVLQLVGSNEHGAAAQERDSTFEQAYDALAGTLERAQSNVAERIASNQDSAELVALVTRVLITLLIPGAVVVAYWSIARRQLREKQVEMDARLGAQREMVAGVSHELRTPLTAIYGFSEALLQGNVTDPDEANDLLRVINTEAADLSRMVEDLLTAARLDADELTFAAQDFDPRIEIRGVIAPFHRAGHEIRLDCAAMIVNADRVRFRQILRNLISNAVQHGGPGITVSGSRAAGRAVFVVTDGGPGVDDETRSRLFEPFGNAGQKALVSGSVGLGLAVSKAVAIGMGGDLTYDRSSGLTSFALTLPDDTHRTDDTEHAAQADPWNLPSSAGAEVLHEQTAGRRA